MKKIIALALALILALLIVACDNGGTVDPKETTGGSPEQNEGDVGGSGGPSSDGSDPFCSEGDGGGEDADPTVPTLFDGTVVDETVYLAVDAAYYRSTADEYEDNLVDRVTWGTELRRVCYNSDWSIIVLNEEYYYLPTEALSKETPEEQEEYTAVNDKVIVEESDVVLRTAPIATDVTAQLDVEEGTELTRVGYSDRWSIISYEGLKLYIEIESHSDSQGSSDDIVINDYEGTLTVKVTEAKIYSIPTVDGEEVLGTAKKNAELVAIGVSADGSWYQIRFLDSSSGKYIECYVQESDVNAVAAE